MSSSSQMGLALPGTLDYILASGAVPTLENLPDTPSCGLLSSQAHKLRANAKRRGPAKNGCGTGPRC